MALFPVEISEIEDHGKGGWNISSASRLINDIMPASYKLDVMISGASLTRWLVSGVRQLSKPIRKTQIGLKYADPTTVASPNTCRTWLSRPQALRLSNHLCN